MNILYKIEGEKSNLAFFAFTLLIVWYYSLMNIDIKIKKVDSDAKVPDQPYEGDAGFDLYANKEVSIKPGEKFAVPTGIALAIPLGYVGLIWDKSGVAIKSGMKVLGGVIDSGYRGEILVGIVNLSNEIHKFKKGDKVAQMLIQEVSVPHLEEVEELDETERGDKGFGSSGK